MCLIMLHLPGEMPIGRKKLSAEWSKNPHGAGLAYTLAGRIIVKRTMDFKELLKMYRAAPVEAVRLVHLRYATHGSRDKSNVHPFPICKGAAMLAHNGIINGADRTDAATWSDSKCIADALAEVPVTLAMSDRFAPLISGLCRESGSKMVILTYSGQHRIFGEDKGEWVNGTWYSVPRRSFCGAGYSATAILGYSATDFCRGTGYPERDVDADSPDDLPDLDGYDGTTATAADEAARCERDARDAARRAMRAHSQKEAEGHATDAHDAADEAAAWADQAEQDAEPSAADAEYVGLAAESASRARSHAARAEESADSWDWRKAKTGDPARAPVAPAALPAPATLPATDPDPGD